MLGKCGNPKCTRRFLRLSQGKLFWQEAMCETGAHGHDGTLRMIWFCDECARQLTTAARSSDAEFTLVLRWEDRERSLAQMRATHS